jgi:hypothetical protein
VTSTPIGKGSSSSCHRTVGEQPTAVECGAAGGVAGPAGGIGPVGRTRCPNDPAPSPRLPPFFDSTTLGRQFRWRTLRRPTVERHGGSAVFGMESGPMSPAPRNRAEPVPGGCRTHCLQGRRVPPTTRHAARHRPAEHRGKETFDFCGLIDRREVKMESVLACLLLRNRHEQQARHPIRSRPDLELVRDVAHDNPAQGFGPPSTKRARIMSGDDDLLPNEIHIAVSAMSVSQADCSSVQSSIL